MYVCIYTCVRAAPTSLAPTWWDTLLELVHPIAPRLFSCPPCDPMWRDDLAPKLCCRKKCCLDLNVLPKRGAPPEVMAFSAFSAFRTRDQRRNMRLRPIFSMDLWLMRATTFTPLRGTEARRRSSAADRICKECPSGSGVVVNLLQRCQNESVPTSMLLRILPDHSGRKRSAVVIQNPNDLYDPSFDELPYGTTKLNLIYTNKACTLGVWLVWYFTPGGSL